MISMESEAIPGKIEVRKYFGNQLKVVVHQNWLDRAKECPVWKWKTLIKMEFLSLLAILILYSLNIHGETTMTKALTPIMELSEVLFPRNHIQVPSTNPTTFVWGFVTFKVLRQTASLPNLTSLMYFADDLEEKIVPQLHGHTRYW